MSDNPTQPVQQDQPVQENPDDQNQTPEPKPEEKPSLPAEAPAKEGEESKPSESPEVKIVEKEVIKKIPVEVIKEVKVVNEEEVKKQAEVPEFERRINEKLKEKLLENKKKVDEARTQRRKSKIYSNYSSISYRKPSP